MTFFLIPAKLPDMTMPRSSLISLSDTPWYHLVSRCVRRAYLCGEDYVTGQNYEHRRGWIENRIQELASVFAVDIAAYAVMSNHYHLVVRIDSERPQTWSDQEVLERWTKLFTGPLLVQRFLSDERNDMSPSELAKVAQWVEIYCERLFDLSWFMRVLNESIARMANEEDGCTGRFWEGRFKSQALLDEQAVLMAMSYVDLNPIRAGIAESPEQSEYTSIKQRIEKIKGIGDPTDIPSPTPETNKRGNPNTPADSLKSEEQLTQLSKAPLMPFEATEILPASIPYAFVDYLELVDYLGKAIHPTKRGSIPETLPKILGRLNIDPEIFIEHAATSLSEFGTAVGIPDNLTALAAARQKRHLHGIRQSRKLFEALAA